MSGPAKQEQALLRRISATLGIGGIAVPAILAGLAKAFVSFPQACLMFSLFLFMASESVALVTGLFSSRFANRPVIVCLIGMAVAAVAGGIGFFVGLVVVLMTIG